MLRYVTGVSLQDRACSGEVAALCSLGSIDVMKARRSQWFAMYSDALAI